MDTTVLLQQMVSLNSVSPGEYRLGEFLSAFLREHGFSVKRQKVGERRYNIFAVHGHGRKAIAFYGHLDTVPVVNASEWKSDPFRLTQRAGRLYGLGAYDMKGGIAAFIEACVRSDAYTKILLSVDEENISEGAWAVLQTERKFFSDVDLIISAEPNFALGLAGVTRGRTGRYVFDVQFEGKPAHLARHEEGIDAIQMLGEFVKKLYAQRQRLFHTRGSFVQVREVKGEAVGMSVSAHAQAQVEVLSGYKDSVRGIQRRLQALTQAKVVLRARKTPYLPGYYFSTFPYRSRIGTIIRRVTGRPMKLYVRTSVGDDNVLATMGIPVITWGPDGGNAHAPNEYVSRSSLDMLSSMYCAFLERKRAR
jgi:acetylornithine deacetylase/succinyl-diaminopimelate desuccinylase-like protein